MNSIILAPMKCFRSFPRKLFAVAAALGCVTFVLAAAPAGDKSTLLPLLGRSVDWYRQIDSLQDKAGSTREIVVRQFARQHALQALTLEFQYARAEAPSIDAASKHVAAPTTAAVRLEQTTAQLASAQTALAQVNSQLATASGADRAPLVAMRDKLGGGD